MTEQTINLLCLRCFREDYHGTTLEAATLAGWEEVARDPYPSYSRDAWDHFGYCSLCFPGEKAEREDWLLEFRDLHKWDELQKPIRLLKLKPSDFEGHQQEP
jgi:hypothetical protein